MKFKLVVIAALLVAAAALAGCGTMDTQNPNGQKSAMSQALSKARNAKVYVPKNNVELENYNKRQELADDPTTILWCTSSFNTPASPMFTVPVVGKLTSGNKRPFPTTVTKSYYQDDGSYNPELPGPDGMFGTSGEYRYGFDPTGNYLDFYNLSTFCTTQPTVWQRQNTKVVLSIDHDLGAADKAAQAALARGDKAGAARILENAIHG